MLQRLLVQIGWLLTGVLLLSSVIVLQAQPLPYSASQRQQIDKFGQTLQKTYEANYSQALSVAQRLGRPLKTYLPDGQIMTLQGLNERGNLVYYVTHSATQAGITTRTNSLYAGGSLGLNLSGSSASVQTKLGIWDGGAVRATHVELAGRVTQMDKPSTVIADEEHPSHVSGIMIASGINPLVRGMAYKANLKAWDYKSDAAEMAVASPNLLVSNHSYGNSAGFFPNTDATSKYAWIWYGDTTVSQTYDYTFGIYDSYTRSFDQISVNAPNYLIVASAGNSRGYNGPAAGEAYILGNYGTGRNIISTKQRDNQTGYDLIAPPATAKNSLAVGSISNLTNGYTQPADVNLSSFSSWGPTDDGRIKPDIVGAGASILSCNSASDSSYVVLSGTSMSSPNVAGSVLLLQEYYTQLHNGSYMRSSTLRGLILHTADEAGTTPGPDYQYGWGLLNVERAARVMGNADKTNLLSERTLTQGQHDTIQVVASGRGPLLATICWTDPVGTASSGILNDRTPKLVNDLDVRISNGQSISQPWTLDPTKPGSAAVAGDNIRDNIEQIRIDNAVPGKTYTVVITNKGTLSGSKQDYALIVSGAGGQAYCASAPTSTDNSKITNVTFGSINQAGASGCTTYTDFTQDVAIIQANQTIPLTVVTGTCGTANNVIVKAFADWNANGNFTDAGETIATSGVLNAGTFTANVTIPQSVTTGQLVRLRIVAVETTDPNAVVPCGSYNNGETQDYVLRVTLTSNDVGVTSLVSPANNYCPNFGTTVSVQVQNFGSQTQTNVPVTIQIIDPLGATVATLTGTVPTLAPSQSDVLMLSSSGLILNVGQTYRFTATTTLATDQNAANNQFSDTRTVAPATMGGIFTAASCGSDTVISLTNSGNATAFWYDAPTGGNLLAAGNRTSYNKIPAGGVLYASLNEFNGRLGPASKSNFGGGSYAQFGPSPLLTTTVPITLASARLYIGRSGQIKFSVSKLNGTIVSSVIINAKATRTLPLSATTSNGQLADDPNDQGAVYPLNLMIPQAGDYQISVDYDDSVSIFRSNVNVSGFPFRLTTANGQSVVSTRGSLFDNASTGKVDTLTTAWYYLYDLQIRAADCPGTQRQAVSITAGSAATATITPNTSTSICQGTSLLFQANTGAGLSYQWYRNGQIITGATSSTLQATTAGSYAVAVASTCLPVRSAAVTVTVNTAQTPIIITNGFTLTTNATTNIQWLFNGVAISGATSATYVVTQSGRYSVQGSVNGCGGSISDDVYLTILATEPLIDDGTLTVYPNPATRLVTVSMTSAVALPKLPTVRLTNLNGQTVRTAILQRDGKNYLTVFDVADLPGGTFFVVVDDDQGQSVRVKRIHKQ